MYYVCNSVNLFKYDNYRLEISEQVQYEYVKVSHMINYIMNL